jgi:hypothetical protein
VGLLSQWIHQSEGEVLGLRPRLPCLKIMLMIQFGAFLKSLSLLWEYRRNETQEKAKEFAPRFD